MIQPKRRITHLITRNSTTTYLRSRTQRAMLDMYNVRSIGAAEKTRTSTGVTPQRPQRCPYTNIIRDLLNSALSFTRSLLPVNCQMCANVDQMCPLRTHKACLTLTFSKPHYNDCSIVIYAMLMSVSNVWLRLPAWATGVRRVVIYDLCQRRGFIALRSSNEFVADS